ncbi:MAG TPA: hypothetical protein DDY78_04640 [Planctomycetales bacterium]|nr:hypothetical protein [Planctomycetales bacterium]
MSYLSPPPVNDVDGALRAFFKAQMPAPWPSLKAPAPPVVVATAKGWPMMRSRLALAASVAVLALGLSFLSGAFHVRANPLEQRITVDGASASAENDPLRHPVQPPLKVKAMPVSAP